MREIKPVDKALIASLRSNGDGFWMWAGYRVTPPYVDVLANYVKEEFVPELIRSLKGYMQHQKDQQLKRACLEINDQNGVCAVFDLNDIINAPVNSLTPQENRLRSIINTVSEFISPQTNAAKIDS